MAKLAEVPADSAKRSKALCSRERYLHVKKRIKRLLYSPFTSCCVPKTLYVGYLHCFFAGGERKRAAEAVLTHCCRMRSKKYRVVTRRYTPLLRLDTSRLQNLPRQIGSRGKFRTKFQFPYIFGRKFCIKIHGNVCTS